MAYEYWRIAGQPSGMPARISGMMWCGPGPWDNKVCAPGGIIGRYGLLYVDMAYYR